MVEMGDYVYVMEQINGIAGKKNGTAEFEPGTFWVHKLSCYCSWLHYTSMKARETSQATLVRCAPVSSNRSSCY